MKNKVRTDMFTKSMADRWERIRNKVYDVQDVIDAGFTLEPLKCRNCGSLEVTFYQYVGDAQCAECGEWQLEIEPR